jgi:glycosyltransferase involved in cell wall biosynthesis
MKIGYLHSDSWPPIKGDSIYSWEIFSRLKKKHLIYTDDKCPFPGAIKSYKNVFDLSRFFNTIDVLLIVTEGYFNFYVEKFTLLSLLKKNLPVVWLTQAPIEESALFSEQKKHLSLKKAVRAFSAKFVDSSICVSEVMQKYSQKELGIARSICAPNGADPILFNPAKPAQAVLQSLKGTYKVFWTGSAEFPWQGIDTIVEVAKAMWQVDKHVVFILMTSGSNGQLPQFENIVWLQPVPYDHLPTFLAAADVCLSIYHRVVPTIDFYNSPSKLFNYMAMAKPVIASDIGQMSSVIESKYNGLLTNNTPKDIVERILYLKTHPRIAHKFGAQARKDVLSYYNWGRLAKTIEKSLFEAVQRQISPQDRIK